MLMAKTELDNTINLTKSKLQMKKNDLISYVRIAFLISVISVLFLSIGIFQKADEVRYMSVSNTSILFFIAAVSSALFANVSYRRDNNFFSIYPQTNTSRFLSSQVLIHGICVLLAMSYLMLYFIQYGFLKIISVFRGNIFFAYGFSFQFLLAGFLVNVIYMFLAAAIITLGATLLRKFKTYAVLVIGILGAFVVYFYPFVTPYLKRVLGIITNEKYILVFLFKGFLMWFTILSAAFFINKKTVYYKTEKVNSKVIFTIIIIMMVLVVIGGFTFSSYKYKLNYEIKSQYSEEITREEYFRRNEGSTIELDVSSIAPGTTMNLHLDDAAGIKGIFQNIRYGDDMNQAPVGKILVQYVLPADEYEGVNLIRYTNPQLTARLEGNNLFIGYTYNKNVKVVFISPWSFMGQFEGYRGKGIFDENLGRSWGSRNGSVNILLPVDGTLRIIQKN